MISQNINDKHFIKAVYKDLNFFNNNNDEELKSLICFKSVEEIRLTEVFQTSEEICKFICYLGLYCEYKEENILNSSEENDYTFEYFTAKISKAFNDSEIIAILKILTSFLWNETYLKVFYSIDLFKFFEDLIKLSSKYFKNPYFFDLFFEHCTILLNKIEINETVQRIKDYLSEEIFPYLIDFFDFYISNLSQGQPLNSFYISIINSKNIAVNLLKKDNPKVLESLVSLTKHVIQT